MNMFLRKCGGMLIAAVVLSAVSAEAFTLIVAPARYSVMQVAQDVLQRTPSVLVSYQGDAATAEPLLHAWNGREWVPMSMKDYREVSFLQRTPDEVVLIGGQDVLPQALVDASSWAPRVERVSDLTTGALVNEFGRIMKWRDSEWRWFAKRYNLALTDEAEPRRRSSWYDQPGPLPDRPDLRPPSARAVEAPAVEVKDVPSEDLP
ncbi:MAG: hypothetical protein H3C50_07075 [Kiritimatiellae bacterium]|nr:hypothetical protein [Kiritimatiellia bacterium]MCO5069514.1 hypothetical protein [Kiritimatiellia bacterium]